MLTHFNDYHLPNPATMPAPISGRYLAHNHLSPVKRAFGAADTKLGKYRPTDLTVLQCAGLWRVNPTYTHWAIKRQAERAEIVAGRIPLVPAHLGRKANGHDNRPTINAIKTLQNALRSIPILDSDLIDLVRSVGVNRVFEAVVAAEAAQ